MTRIRFFASLLLLGAAMSGAGGVIGQTIPVRTVPVASGDQFSIVPSATGAMGGVRLAVDDSIADAWSNPAMGTLVPESAFFGAPALYTISEEGGAGRTFPVGMLMSGSGWFGGGVLALQQIENDTGFDAIFAEPVLDVCCWNCCGRPVGRTLSDAFGRNVYASGFLGRRVNDDWSIGFGLSGARLGAMDGVDLLYQGSQRIEQSGHSSDVRLGVYRSGERERLSLLVLHSRLSMKHEVTWLQWRWDEQLMRGFSQRRVDLNEDETRTWGGQVAWDRSLDAPGWRVGASATVNYKDHPKIPNYSLQNIPRDPGTTWAYEAALGFSRTHGPSTFALDFALQPIWSETWQEANAQDVLDSGNRLRLGERSIENDFFFTNVVIRSGLSHRLSGIDLLGGLEIRSYAYHLEQMDYVANRYREQDEDWIEWSPTLGAVFRFEALDLRYAGRITHGTGTPGTGWPGPGLERAATGADFIPAPEGPLTLVDARVMTHQLSVHIPVR